MSNFQNIQSGGGGGSYGQNYYDTSADFSTQPAPSNNPNQGGGIDFNAAVNQAQYHKKNSKEDDEDDDEDSSFFSKAVSFISEHKDKFGKEDIDEQKITGAHQALYGGGSGSSGGKNDAETLGSGAALQALKMFMGSGDQKDKNGGGAQDQNKLIGIAMAQAGKLWEQKNKKGEVATDKQSAVNSAAKIALQMYMKGGSGGGAGGLGGLGGLAGRLGGQSGGSDLLNIAKKFL